MKQFTLLSLLSFFLLRNVALGQADIQVTYLFFSPESEAAFEKAVEIWENALVSNQTIKIRAVRIDATSLGFLGMCISNGAKDFPNAPLPDTWYPSALADALANTDQNPGHFDMDILMDSTSNWYYGLDANAPAGSLDFVRTAMHEIGHGLGFFSAANVVNNQGSFSLVIDPLVNVVASFPIPNLAGKPFIYDRFVETFSGDQLVDTTQFPNPSTALASAFQSNQLFFNGAAAVAANGSRPRLYAPSVFSFGSSVLHLNETTFDGTPNALMTPFSDPVSNHSIGPVTLAILQDFGWTLNPSTSTVQPPTSNYSLKNAPNPFSSQTQILFELDATRHIQLTVLDVMGRTIETLADEVLFSGLHQYRWAAQDVPNGIYFCRLVIDNQVVVRKMVVNR